MYFLSSNITDQVTDAVTSKSDTFSLDSIVAYFQSGLPVAANIAIKVIVAIIIIFIGRKVLKSLRKLIHKCMLKTSLEIGVQQFIEHILYACLWVVLIIVILSTFGIGTGSIIAIVGSAGLSIGLALQGSLSNFAGGFLILILKPFRVGDYISEDTHGNIGTVQEIQLCYTKLLTPDRRTIILPNGNLANCSLTNYTKDNKMMVKINVRVPYETDIKKIKTLLEKSLTDEPDRIEDVPVSVYIDSLAENAIVLGIQVYVCLDNYWTAKGRIIEMTKSILEENEIQIPPQQMEVKIRS